MACPKCLTPAVPGSAFCTECGARLEIRCPACGADGPPGAHFCRACGQAFEEARVPPLTRTPAAYTPRHLTEKVLTSRAALEGQRKQVTVLFLDVKSSQELARSVDAEVWHGVLDRYFTILAAGIHRFEGTINQYTGDGIMAIFGAPIAHEDHAQRACFAALALRDELAAFSTELRRALGLDFSTRMGINSGEVVVGRIGDDLRMDYTAQGPTVGLAARMEALAEPGKIYLTKTTAQLVTGFFELKDLGRFSVRGEPRSLRVYELRGVGPLRRRFELARQRGLTPFVGRDAEMRILEESLAQALSGQGQSVDIASEAGLGKSRLCWEFSARCRARGITVLEASGVPHARSIALVPIAELLRGFFGAEEKLDPAVVRERIAGEVASLDESLIEALPRIFELLRVEDPERPVRRTDPEVRQRELLALVADLIRRRSEREPLLIVAEDLHWYDGASATVLARLVETLRETRTLLLLTRRTGAPLPLRAGGGEREIVLEPLAPEATRALVDGLLGDHPSLAGLARRIAERSEGHAFFIEEMIQALVANRDLAGEEGDYRAVGTVEELSLPATVSALLDARIDALDERERLVLQAASVLGRELAAPVLEQVVDLPPAETRAALDALCEIGLLRRSDEHAPERRTLGFAILGFIERLTASRPRGEELYLFRHALLQEVAYRSQLAQRRSRVHTEVARTLEGLGPEGLDERAGLIAHHLESAGDALAAAEWYARSARWQGANDPAESFRCWQKVRSLCRQVEETAESLALFVRAGIQTLNLSWRLGVEEGDVAAIFDETRAAAERSGRPDAVAGALGTFAVVRGMAGHVRESRARILEATRLAASAGRPGLEVALTSALVYAEASAGDLRAALASAEHGLALGGSEVALGADLAFFRPVVFLTALRGFLLIHLGRLEEAERALDLAQAISDPARDAEVSGWISGWRVLHARATGRREGALADARRGLEIAERNGSPFSQVIALAALGRAHALVREWPEAVAALERSLALARARRTGLETEASILADLAAALLGAGSHEHSLRVANEATRIARRRGLELDEGIAELVLARVLLETSQGAKRRSARKHLERALECARRTGARSLEAQVHLGLARVARHAGDEAVAAAELSRGLELLREIGADGHAATVAAELATDVGATSPDLEPLVERDG